MKIFSTTTYFITDQPSANVHPHNNSAILVECKRLRRVVALEAKAETAGVFHNTQMAIPIRRILKASGHSQPPTPINTDNLTTSSFIYKNIHFKNLNFLKSLQLNGCLVV